ncbi:hypothetical protein PHYC_03143 [Phycisphaerales bacterium]|nr:hypothetical protein PHYC_03143 [Phycisphaerales bacterium]
MGGPRGGASVTSGAVFGTDGAHAAAGHAVNPTATGAVSAKAATNLASSNSKHVPHPDGLWGPCGCPVDGGHSWGCAAA